MCYRIVLRALDCVLIGLLSAPLWDYICTQINGNAKWIFGFLRILEASTSQYCNRIIRILAERQGGRSWQPFVEGKMAFAEYLENFCHSVFHYLNCSRFFIIPITQIYGCSQKLNWWTQFTDDVYKVRHHPLYSCLVSFFDKCAQVSDIIQFRASHLRNKLLHQPPIHPCQFKISRFKIAFFQFPILMTPIRCSGSTKSALLFQLKQTSPNWTSQTICWCLRPLQHS